MQGAPYPSTSSIPSHLSRIVDRPFGGCVPVTNNQAAKAAATPAAAGNATAAAETKARRNISLIDADEALAEDVEKRKKRMLNSRVVGTEKSGEWI